MPEELSSVPDIDNLKRASGGRIRISRFDPGRLRERTRSWAVLVPGGLVAGEVLFILVARAEGRPVEDLKDISAIVPVPTVTLLGTVPGFCFSSGN